MSQAPFKLTLADLIQVAADEGRDPADVVLVVKTDDGFDGLSLVEDEQRGMAGDTPFVLLPFGVMLRQSDEQGIDLDASA